MKKGKNSVKVSRIKLLLLLTSYLPFHEKRKLSNMLLTQQQQQQHQAAATLQNKKFIQYLRNSNEKFLLSKRINRILAACCWLLMI